MASLTQQDFAAWRELASVALEPNPFFEAEYVLPLARGLSQLDDVALAVVCSSGTWAACCPVRRASQWHHVPLPSLSLWQGHPLYSLLGTPLINPDQAETATSTLVKLLVHRRDVFFAGFDWLVEDGPVYRALRTALAVNGIRSLRFERFERAFLKRRPQADYLEQALSPKHRRDLKRQWRKLGDRLGVEPRIVDRAGEHAAVDKFVHLEGASKLAARGTVLASNPNHVKFFKEMCAGFADQGRLQLLALEAAGRTIAMKCNILADPGIYFFKIAYDETFASHSPGIQLEAEMTERFHDRRQAEWMDSCSDRKNTMHNRLMPDRRSLVTIVAIDPTVRAAATVPAVRGVRFLRDRRIEAMN